MKTADISATKQRKYLKAKVNKPKTNNKTRNTRDLYRGINDFKKD